MTDKDPRDGGPRLTNTTVDPVVREADCKSASRGSIPPTVSKRFPKDYTRRELVALINHHHQDSIRKGTALLDLQERYIAKSKELSALKKERKP